MDSLPVKYNEGGDTQTPGFQSGLNLEMAMSIAKHCFCVPLKRCCDDTGGGMIVSPFCSL